MICVKKKQNFAGGLVIDLELEEETINHFNKEVEIKLRPHNQNNYNWALVLLHT